MQRCKARRRSARAALYALLAGVVVGVSGRADAFDLKHDARGQTLRWVGSSVSYVIDPSVEEAVPGGAQAVSSAVKVWNGAAGAPALTTAEGKAGAKPGLDGINSILFAPEGFAPAGNALAVTITSYDDATGNILDADVVINGIHKFAVLPADARAADGTARVATDGAASEESGPRAAQFDVAHVVSHEVGHSLGLADERSNDSALMYAFTMPGDAATRMPSMDDIGGMAALYGTAARVAGPAPASQPGCGQASVAGARARPEDAWAAFALLCGAGGWLASRRRAKAARIALPLGAAFVVLLAGPAPARSAEASSAPADTARVVAVSTTNEGGLFETTLDLVPMSCPEGHCPVRSQGHTWGGTLAGITQRVGNDPVTSVGDVVHVRYVESNTDHDDGRANVIAAVLSSRH